MNTIQIYFFNKQNSIKNKIQSVQIKKNKNTNFLKKLKVKFNLINKKQCIHNNLITYTKHNYNFTNFFFFNTITKQIVYRFILNISYTNIFINILNNLNEQICSFSLGYIKYKSLDKITKKYILLQSFKNLVNKTKKYVHIAVHYHSNNNFYSKLIINFLKSYYIIQVLKFYNYLPHNGCRPKKKRRK